MRKNRDFVFLQPMKWLGIGMMAALAVAMFRLVLTDESIPASVAKMKFCYLGGSSTFSSKDGYGCVNSKQTEIRSVADDGIYEIYTMPHTEEDVLTKLTVAALDANDNIIKERLFENVPVIRNQVTRYTGSFFGSGGGGATKTYTYSTSDQLEAGYKINISGTYTEAVGVNLTGTITGATWLGERTISFTFDESGSTAVNTGSGSGEANGGSGGSEAGSAAANVPAVGDTYLGCYVLAVDDAEDHAEVLVVAPADITGTFYGSGADNAVATALGTVTVDGISGWEVPDRDQASLIFNARGSIGGLTHNSYLCLNNGYKCFFVGGGATAFTPTYSPNDQTDTALRPVATVTIAKE